MKNQNFLKMAVFALLVTLANGVQAEEVKHDPSACPDLTGYFIFPDEVFEPMKLKVVSDKNSAGVPTLNMIDPDSGNEDLTLLDGEKKTEGALAIRAVCSDLKVFFYEYENEKTLRTSTLSLDLQKDLVLEILEDGQEPLREVGKRQPQDLSL